MKLKKLLVLTLTILLVFSLFVGCTPNKDPEDEASVTDPTDEPAMETDEVEATKEPVKEPETLDIPKGTAINFWHAMSGADGEAVDFLIAKFNETNEYGIEVVATFQGKYGDLDRKMIAVLSGGEIPHMAQGYANNIVQYQASDMIVQLDSYIFDENFGVVDFEDIIEGYRNENSAYVDGMFYSLPFNKSTEVLYYNKTFFEENELTVPTNWEELASVSKAATAILRKPAFGYDSLANLFITWTQQAGGEYTDSQGNVMFDNPQAREALTFFKTGIDAGYFRTAGEDGYMSGPFNDGKAVMFIGSTPGSAYVGNDTFEWDAAQVPFGKEKKVIQQGSNMFMLKSNEAEQAATFEFMKFVMDTENTAQWAILSGYLPVRVSARDLPVYKEFVAAGTNPTKAIGTSYDPSWYIYDAVFEASYNVRVAVRTLVDEVVSDTKDIETAMAEAVASLS